MHWFMQISVCARCTFAMHVRTYALTNLDEEEEAAGMVAHALVPVEVGKLSGADLGAVVAGAAVGGCGDGGGRVPAVTPRVLRVLCTSTGKYMITQELFVRSVQYQNMNGKTYSPSKH